MTHECVYFIKQCLVKLSVPSLSQEGPPGFGEEGGLLFGEKQEQGCAFTPSPKTLGYY